MTIKIKNTQSVSMDGIKVLVYGKAGIGKTTLMSTAPNPIILSCESGLLSIAEKHIPYIEVQSIQEITEAYDFLTKSNEAKEFQTVCLDSLSEIAEVFLAELKQRHKDARQAYGQLADDLSGLIRAFRDIKGKNVVFSAKQARVVDEDTGLTLYVPSMPGKSLSNSLPFFFDEVFYLTMLKDDNGKNHRAIKTYAEYNTEGKDRSGKLNPIEKPDLTAIFNKIQTKESN